MREFIGVKSSFDVFTKIPFEVTSRFSTLKQEALMFDKVAIPYLTEFLSKNFNDPRLRFNGDLEWLLQNGIICDSRLEAEERLAIVDEYKSAMHIRDFMLQRATTKIENLIGGEVTGESDIENLFKEAISKHDVKDMLSVLWSILTSYGHYSEYIARCIGIRLRELENKDAYPIVSTWLTPLRRNQTNKTDVINITFEKLPVPDDSTAWEQIVDFRNDTEARGKFLALRHWMSEVARAKLTQAEIEEKLEWLIYEYQRHLNFHRVKTNAGTLETIVVTCAEALENLVTVKWGKLAKSLFSIRQRRVALMEAELKSPGNEVAYIVQAKDRFAKGDR